MTGMRQIIYFYIFNLLKLNLLNVCICFPIMYNQVYSGIIWVYSSINRYNRV